VSVYCRNYLNPDMSEAFRSKGNESHLTGEGNVVRCKVQYCQQAFVKLFKRNNIDVVKSCQSYFGFSLLSEEWAKRAKNLDAKYIACERAFVHYIFICNSPMQVVTTIKT